MTSWALSETSLGGAFFSGETELVMDIQSTKHSQMGGMDCPTRLIHP
jgi:hypothetical protein